MIVNVTWVPYIPGTNRQKVTKRSDEGSSDMYLTDNLGNHYSFVALGGDAAKKVVVAHGETYRGAYIFPPAKPGAHTFTFHDSDNGVTIENLILNEPTIAIYEFLFPQSNMATDYRDDIWEAIQDESGTPTLNYLPLANCQLQEAKSSEPTGKLKNTMEIGQLTFEIYGWMEQEWGIREYRAIAGPNEFNLENTPMFLVKVPLENSLQCLNEISTILADLRPQEP